MHVQADMAKIISDRFGERMKAGPNDSSEDENEKRQTLVRAKP